MILDGVMVMIAYLCLTVMHPGIAFGRNKWRQTRFRFRKGKGDVEEDDTEEIPTESPASSEKERRYYVAQREAVPEVN
jgi:hypothetical protein